MRVVLQRVNKATLTVEGELVGSIDKGYIVFLGVGASDERETVERMVDKIYRLRIFADSEGKTNLSAKDVNGEILVVSQFTLMADLSSNRPSFSRAAPQEKARDLYEYFIEECAKRFSRTSTGRFASHMHISAENDGPFTLVLEY